MFLKCLTIGDFRAFGPTQTIEFAQPIEGKAGSGLTIFVGPNNSGKSTIVKAIKSLLSHDETFVAAFDDRRLKESPKLAIKFHASEDFEVSLQERSDAAHLNKLGNYKAAADLLRFIPARRPWTDRFAINPGMDASSYENQFYANLKNNEFYVDQNFGQAMHLIDRSPEKREQFSTLLKQIEPTTLDWSIDNDGTRDFISFASISGGMHRAGALGDGVINLFRIVYSLYSLKSEVLLLDEPQLSLHPQCQRRLHEMLSDAAKANQIILSTHSPYFTSWTDIKRGCKIYRANLRNMRGAEIDTISSDTIARIIAIADKDKKNRKLYDVVAKEVFFSRGCLFVEGQEDAHLEHLHVLAESGGGFPQPQICGFSMPDRIGTRIAMGKPYSQDLRERVIATVDSGTRVCAAARLFLVSVSYVSKAVGRRRTTGETMARVGRAGRKPKLAPHDQAIRARVAAHPDATLAELQAWLAAECKVEVSIGCLWNRLKFLKPIFDSCEGGIGV
jgi:AAA15 family ATPase/GTPase/transposase